MFKKFNKNLLSKNLEERVALSFKFPNIQPRFLKGFRQLIILCSITLFLTGYQPILTFPPVSRSVVLAEESHKQEILTDILPEINLPHPGYISTRFGRWHPGVDIVTGLGMPVHPITEGIVEEVHYGFFGYGNHVFVSHPKGLRSLYGHLGRVYVKRGQMITSSDTLGTVGVTGATSGPHTHLEIQRDGKYIDPTTILPKLQNYPGDNKDKKLSKTLKPDFN